MLLKYACVPNKLILVQGTYKLVKGTSKLLKALPNIAEVGLKKRTKNFMSQ